ncbi:hypothetical protein L2095_27465 [Bacillus zanthoxyli]|nr:hypothetical protein [Bacillus zanthoxyli]
MSKLIVMCIISILLTFNWRVNVMAETERIPQNNPPTVMELAFLRGLGPTILNVMNKHGDLQLFTSGRIEKIARNEQSDFYDIKLRVIGYEGAINPPYKLSRMTLRLPGENYTDYSVIQYEHKKISSDEFRKLSKFVDR